MTVFLLIGIAIILVFYYRYRLSGEREWRKRKPVDIEGAYAENMFSIIVAFRNEENNLPNLLASITQLDYPSANLEVILVDDESDDNSARIVQEFASNTQLKIRVLSSRGGKKAAIHTGIIEAKGEYILTTDADCILPPQWVKAYDALLEEEELDFVAGPVCFRGEGFLNKIFTLEFDALQAATALSICKQKATMSNGANLCFRREVYSDLHSLQPHLASGEDVFLMTFIKKQLGKNKIGYCKSSNAMVTTHPPKDLKAYFQQRIRWTSKSKAYRDWDIISTALSVLLLNAFIITLLIVGIWKVELLLLGMLVFAVKAYIDFHVLSAFLVFFKRERILSYFPFALLFTMLSTFVIGIIGQFVKVEWKGRRI